MEGKKDVSKMKLIPNIELIMLEHKRNGKPIRQNELAKELNVTVSAVSNWVNGSTMPEAKTLFKLAYLLDRTVDELYTVNWEDEE
ncbi:helix-turn-helix domain-containing protein [Laceyella putida]|uniref:Helix-turn-helix domain-containing protein n=1 Tax=Laceyella putida TaxID=110101 RepID=A0ABW2RR54_9BACL